MMKMKFAAAALIAMNLAHAGNGDDALALIRDLRCTTDIQVAGGVLKAMDISNVPAQQVAALRDSHNKINGERGKMAYRKYVVDGQRLIGGEAFTRESNVEVERALPIVSHFTTVSLMAPRNVYREILPLVLRAEVCVLVTESVPK
ncbi:MAG: hypothetical protein AAB276_03370 [Pseudomonadota bacterium]|mgnify:CR=1 FL=1